MKTFAHIVVPRWIGEWIKMNWILPFAGGLCVALIPTVVVIILFIVKNMDGADTQCKYCGEYIKSTYKYCPSCGSKMNLEVDS